MDLELSPQMEILISLAEASSVLPLDKLAKELNIAPGEELEEFLINAIRSKVINGKINECTNEFVVTACPYRQFERPQWELLQRRLRALVKNMKKTSSDMQAAFEPSH